MPKPKDEKGTTKEKAETSTQDGSRWSELEEKYKQDIEALTESAEMATIEKEIAEEKLDSCEKELRELKDKFAELTQQLDTQKQEQHAEQSVVTSSKDATVTMLQLQKLEEQNEVLKQALIRIRDISAKDKKEIEDLRIEREELQVKLLDAEEKEHKFTEQVKLLEEQVDVSQSAQEMVEKLTQQKGELEDKLKEMIEDLDSMEKLRDLNEQLLDSARENEIELTGQIDILRVQCSELTKRKRDMEDYLTHQERTVAQLKDENRALNEKIMRMNDQFRESESIEQQKHQIENVAYKLNFSESKMAEKEAEVARYKRNLAELEDQMNNMSSITKEQSARLDELKAQYDAKIIENSDLQRALKKKMEEVSELEIRREMAEKKLQSVQRDRDAKVAELTRTIEKMKGVEIQHEEDMKRLMEDNELIERERRELRDQLNRSNRSLERSMQTMGSVSMVTAQDTSLASLGISFHNTPTMPLSPIVQQQQHPAMGMLMGTPADPNPLNPTQQQTPQQRDNLQQLQSQSTSIGPSAGMTSPPSTGNTVRLVPGSAPSVRRQLFTSSDSPANADSEFLFDKIRQLSVAFDQMVQKNYDLELELAYREIENKPPPYNGCGLMGTSYPSSARVYDVDRIRGLRSEITKFKRDIRAAMINQQICPKSRNIAAHLREHHFNLSKLAIKYQALECEASNLLSNGRGAPARNVAPQSRIAAGPMLQSTPVK